MVVKREIAARHPWVVLNLLKAFERANDVTNSDRVQHGEYHVATGLLPREAGDALRAPVVRHGVRANRKTLETAARYSHEQGLTPRVIGLEELFAPSTMDL